MPAVIGDRAPTKRRVGLATAPPPSLQSVDLSVQSDADELPGDFGPKHKTERDWGHFTGNRLPTRPQAQSGRGHNLPSRRRSQLSEAWAFLRWRCVKCRLRDASHCTPLFVWPTHRLGSELALVKRHSRLNNPEQLFLQLIFPQDRFALTQICGRGGTL